jgi:hypothetical protein
MTKAPSPVASSTPAASLADAEALASRSLDVMEALSKVLNEETELLRAGSLAAAARLSDRKTDLTRLYLADTQALRANKAILARMIPAGRIEALKERHATFQKLLQINLTVLATAHAVSEGIIRGVSGELARKAAPQTYGASGRPVAPPKSASQPLAVSRTL